MAVAVAVLIVSGGTASALDVQHGISFSKGCLPSTKIGDPNLCSYTVQNNVDDAQDSLTIHGLIDTVHAASGDIASSNIVRNGRLITTTAGGAQTGSVCYSFVRAGTDVSATFGSTTITSASAAFTAADVGRQININETVYTIASVTNGTTADLAVAYGTANDSPSGTNLPWIIGFKDPAEAGTAAAPYTNTGFCELPFGSRVGVLPFTHYTVQPADFTLPSHHLLDDATLSWGDECNGLAAGPPPGGGNCNPNEPDVGAGSSTTVAQRTSVTTTTIHDAQHNPVTVVAAGSTVHDFVSVTTNDPDPAQPIPSGNVTIAWFTGTSASHCTNLVTTSAPIAIGANGQVDATGFPQGPLAPGFYGFIAHYQGDSVYLPSDGACEPLTVVDANIQITPNGTNRVGATHTFTAHVNVNDGSGFVPALDGTTITFTIDSDTASSTPNPPTQCTTSGGTGSCTTSITSLTTGVTVVSAHTTVSVAGLSLTRSTNGANGNSGPATKTWVNARIHITPNATNRVGAPHTFTVLLEKDTGNGAGFQPAAGEHVDVTLTNALGASHSAPTGTCTNAGANTDASGQCTITFTSNSTGTVTGHATSTLSVAGSAPFTVATDGAAPNGPDAVKTFVNARIHITPNATNRVGAPHTFTVLLEKDTGNGAGFQPAAGEHVDVTLTNALGASHTAPTGTCTTAGPNTDAIGQCTITFTSNSTGTVTGHATSTLSVAGSAPFTVATDGAAPNGPDAVKTFVNAAITIAPSATNEINHSHTFTVTLVKDTGNGAGFQPAAGEHVDVTLTDSLGAAHTAPTGTCTNAGPNTDANGQCTITFTSGTTGHVTGHATSTLSVAGSAPFTVQTDGVAPNSGDAVKTFVDANIQITPPTAVNPVGTNHTLTGHVNINAGDGNGYVNAPNGTVITFALTNSNGATATFVGPNTCTTSGSTGSCTVQISSPTPGNTTISASTTVSVGGVALTRMTGDQFAGDGPNATKNWQAAAITITPTATNEINHSHTFTAKVFGDVGNGGGLQPVGAGVPVTITLTSSNGASANPAGPFNGNTDANGTFSVTFTSSTAGQVTGHATAVVPVDGHSISVSTNGVAPNSADAVKTFVDANIQVSPATANNPVGKNHTLTGHVNVNTGDGAGYVNAPAGTTISYTLTNSGGATAAFVGPSSCTTAGTTGSCTVVIVSTTTGTTTIRASTNVTVGGVALARSTAAAAQNGNSADAVKTWADDSVTTSILNASGTVITTAQAGTAVHDRAFVTRAPGTTASVPNPTGTIVFHRYTTINCSGTATNQSVALTPGSPGTADSDAFAVTADMSYQADYSGDANYPAHSGACEPLNVTPVPAPAIAIVKNPKGQRVPVGGTAKFKITVTNTGNTVLTNVTVTDPLSPNCNRTSAQIPALATMQPQASVTYSCSRPNTQNNFTNQATATGTPPSGPNVTATDTAPVTVTRPFIQRKVHPKTTSHKRPKATG